METLEDTKLAKDIIQTLLKAKKTIRMYPENNPIYTKTIEDTFSRFAEFFCYRDELDLRIKQNEIFFESEQIYCNPEKDDNLALFFFKDGLRELSFKKGLSKEEIGEFLKIIALDFDREAIDDDIVTLLWEKDFENIKYVADEAFLLEDEDYESEATTEVKKKAPGVDELMKAYADAFRAEDVKETSIVNLTDKDLQMLVREIEKDLEDKTGKLSEIIFEMLLHAEDTAEYEDIYRFIKDIIVYSLKQGDLKTFVDVIKRVKDASENTVIPEIVTRQMNNLLSFISSDESIRYISEIFDSVAEIDENILNEYTGFLDRNAINPFIVALGELKSIQGRKRVINILIHLGKKDIQALARGLQDSRWYVVRNIIYILRHIGDKRAVEYLLTSAKHADIRVRREAIKALGELRSPLALQTLRDCLDDSDPSIRRSAVKALGSIGSETAKRIILERVSKKDFRDREFDEKKEFYETLSLWSDADTADFMMRTLRKRSLFKRFRSDENRACAAYSLGLTGNRDALPVLQKLKDSKNKLLREYVNAAINRIEHGR
ncbi:MAG: hypothetical protein OHK0032_08130 [Thermodesulfovibrionales bacterium]